jgi:hypothetical protein
MMLLAGLPPQEVDMVYVTAVHMKSGGTGHEHIADVKWKNPDSGQVGESTRAEMVDWIKNHKGDAKVTDGRNTVQVHVVESHPPYIQTAADGKWTDNLLALPRY